MRHTSDSYGRDGNAGDRDRACDRRRDDRERHSRQGRRDQENDMGRHDREREGSRSYQRRDDSRDYRRARRSRSRSRSLSPHRDSRYAAPPYSYHHAHEQHAEPYAPPSHHAARDGRHRDQPPVPYPPYYPPPPRPPPPAAHRYDGFPPPPLRQIPLPRPPPPPPSLQQTSLPHIGLPQSQTAISPPAPARSPSYALPPEISLPPSAARFAYVWLVMKGDSYVPGALTAAYSLRLTGSPHDTVCMVTPDVSEQARSRLSLVFTAVVEVGYISAQVRQLRTGKQQQLYARWVSESFTKWRCLELVQYSKVCFLDADKIVLRNIDHIFDLATPAATFSSPWASNFLPASRKNRGSGLSNPYAGLSHGQAVPHDCVEDGLRGSFVLIGTMVLLRPDRGVFEQYLQLLAPYQESSTVLAPLSFGSEGCHSMMDEQSLCVLYHHTRSQQWTFIHQRYNYICWHRSWLAAGDAPFVFHFFNTKPWVLRRTDYLDLEAWWTLAHAMLKDGARWPADDSRALLRAAFDSEQLEGERLDGCAWCKESAVEGWERHRLLDDRGAMACPDIRAKDAALHKSKQQQQSDTGDGTATKAAHEQKETEEKEEAVVSAS